MLTHLTFMGHGHKFGTRFSEYLSKKNCLVFLHFFSISHSYIEVSKSEVGSKLNDYEKFHSQRRNRPCQFFWPYETLPCKSLTDAKDQKWETLMGKQQVFITGHKKERYQA